MVRYDYYGSPKYVEYSNMILISRSEETTSMTAEIFGMRFCVMRCSALTDPAMMRWKGSVTADILGMEGNCSLLVSE